MKKHSLLTVSLLLIVSASYADGIYRVGRYTAIDPVATSQQSDVLSVVVTMNFPDQITTVGGAIQHLLHRSGYRLAALEASDPNIPTLLDLPLPSVHRRLGPIKIDNALRTLSGPAWDLVVDPVHRLVSFDLLESYTKSTLDPLAGKAANF
ncbi:MAG: pili assembly chaperone [Candidatus Thiodiazotropha sp. (ex. Lucinoma kazani)]